MLSKSTITNPPKRTFEFIMVIVCILFANPTPISCMIGFTVSAFGCALKIWASGYKRAKDELDISGPYAFVRHPKSLGTVLLIFGMCLAGRNLYVTCGFMLASALVFWRRIRMEEEKLSRKLSTEFVDYRVQVPTFFPLLKKFRSPKGFKAEYSWRYGMLTRRNRELEGIIAFVLSYAALVGIQNFQYRPNLQLIAVVVAAVLIGAGFFSHRSRKTT